MPEEARHLTDADIAALVEALQRHHPCQFGIKREEFDNTWPVMVDLAAGVAKTKSIGATLLITGVIVGFFSIVARGAWVWFAEVHARVPLPK